MCRQLTSLVVLWNSIRCLKLIPDSDWEYLFPWGAMSGVYYSRYCVRIESSCLNVGKIPWFWRLIGRVFARQYSFWLVWFFQYYLMVRLALNPWSVLFIDVLIWFDCSRHSACLCFLKFSIAWFFNLFIIVIAFALLINGWGGLGIFLICSFFKRILFESFGLFIIECLWCLWSFRSMNCCA